MVTHCDTSLVISNASGDKKDLTELHRFRAECAGELHRFQLATLVPEETGKTEERLKLWGTAEDIRHDHIESDVIVAGEYFLRFLSVETSIAPWVKAVSPCYPNLVFHLDYFNPRQGFEGELQVQGENVLLEYTGKI